MKTKLPYILALVALLTLACSVSTVTPIPAPAIQPSATAPVVLTSARLEHAPAERVMIVSASILTVRAEPSTGARELGYAHEGNELTTTGEYRGGEGDCTHWTGVKWQGGAAWVCSAFIYPR
jgi:hypothetical protein